MTVQKLKCTVNKNDNQLPLEKFSFDKMKEKLDSYLKKNADNETIFDWIDAHIEKKGSEFIRALTTSLVENAIDGVGSSSKFNSKKMLPRLPLLQKYLDHNVHLELQVLYTLQSMVNRLEHPKVLLLSLFEFLYDEDVISDKSFIQWEKSTDPAEQEGKGVALKLLTSFLLWLREDEELSN